MVKPIKFLKLRATGHQLNTNTPLLGVFALLGKT